MIGKSWALIMIIFFVAPTLFAAEERYLCVASKATGFKYSSITNDWESTDFKVDNDKYMIKKSKRDSYEWELTIMGRKIIYGVKADFDHFGYLDIKLSYGHFNFNKKSGRYSRTFTQGYINGGDGNGSGLEYIEIGMCSPF